MKIGQTAILNTEDKGSARIKLELIDESKSGLFPADYWFSYPDAKSEPIWRQSESNGKETTD